MLINATLNWCNLRSQIQIFSGRSFLSVVFHAPRKLHQTGTNQAPLINNIDKPNNSNIDVSTGTFNETSKTKLV